MEFMEKVTKISKIVGKTATDTYNTVADKSGKVFEDAKLKLAIADKEADIEKIYEEIGKTVYDSYLAGEDVGKVFTKEAKKIDKISNEIEEMKKGSTSIKYIEKECICPKLENDACIENSIDNVLDNNSSSTNGKISLNNASLDELMTLDGIGEKKAQAIIEYRKKHSFKSIEEILEVDGIGTATYEKIKDRLTI